MGKGTEQEGEDGGRGESFAAAIDTSEENAWRTVDREKMMELAPK